MLWQDLSVIQQYATDVAQDIFGIIRALVSSIISSCVLNGDYGGSWGEYRVFRVSIRNGGMRKRQQLICGCRGETGRCEVVVYQFISGLSMGLKVLVRRRHN
jgi:hypothetical protein